MLESTIINYILGIIAVIISFVSYYFYIRSQVISAATKAVDDAEQEDKTGEEKLNQATEQVYSLVPVILKGIITKQFVKHVIQDTFDKIQNYAKKQINK